MSVFTLSPQFIATGLAGGLAIGLTGMGGGAVLTPVLLALGVPASTAVGSDLVASLFIKPVAGSVHASAKTVRWDLVRWLCVGSIPAGLAGSLLSNRLTGSNEGTLKRLIGTTLVVAALAMFVTAGGRWRDVGLMFLSAVVLLTIVAFMRPYVMDRFTVFLHPDSDKQGSGYQITQSLIAVGSGGFSGRGFGQSIQKFEYLPEPIGDSIFAVYAEEFGFIGTSFLILLFISFTFRGYKIAAESPDMFGMLIVVGFMTLIACQSFLNIGAMIGVAPLSGLPLPFISHGGTALLSTLIMVGIMLNVSKYRKTKVK